MSQQSQSQAQRLVDTLRKHELEACFHQAGGHVLHVLGLTVLIPEQYPPQAESELSGELYQLK